MEPFLFGVATASFQIEGGAQEGGRSKSIWDTFCKVPGNILNGDTGDRSCDYYHRWKEDLSLIHNLGTDAYRFSISWSRIFPEKDRYNPEGMAFYRDILLELKRLGIRAAVTIYHWDLPQWAQDLGGWENRECTEWFSAYAGKLYEELDDLVDFWITLNEPFCASFISNFEGTHAPGNRNLGKALCVSHHLLLAHGKAVRLYHERGGRKPIGITLNLSPVYPASDSFSDRLAAHIQSGYANDWFLKPLFQKQYPQDICMLSAARCNTDFSFLREGDTEIIGSPLDFLGINFYSATTVRYDQTNLLLNSTPHTAYPKTKMGWDIRPETMIDLLKYVRKEYTGIPVYITENGSAWDDHLENGVIHDPERCNYLIRHLETVREANRLGLDVRGYYCWSLLDNFEWAWGYSRRFGIVYVDYKTEERIPKDSFTVYKNYIAEFKKQESGQTGPV